jgi:hypothetical protein
MDVKVLNDRLIKWAGTDEFARSLTVETDDGTRAVINLARVDGGITAFGWEAPVQEWKPGTRVPKSEKVVYITFDKSGHVPVLVLGGEWKLADPKVKDGYKHLYPRANASLSFDGEWISRVAVPEGTIDISGL